MNDQVEIGDSSADSWNGPWHIRALSVMVAIFMLAIVVVMFVDVIGRYVFDRSVPGGFEMIAYLLGMLIFSGFPLVTRDEDHITVGLMDGAFHGRAEWFRDFGVLIASIAAVGFVSYRVFAEAVLLHADNQYGEVLEVPIAPFIFFMSGLGAISTVLLFIVLAQFIRRGPPATSARR